MKSFRLPIISILIYLFLVSIPSLQAQGTGIQVDIFGVDNSRYPEMTVNFGAYDDATGRFIALTQDNVSVQYANQSVPLVGLTPLTAPSKTVSLMLVIDLTSSVSGNFVQEQVLTAQGLIDRLNPGDIVGLSTFDGDSADLVVRPTVDRNAVLNTMDDLRQPGVPSNVFHDGVAQAVNVLSEADFQSSRRIVIVMTDVEDPQGGASPASVLATAQQNDVTIHMIGFGDNVNVDALDNYTKGIDGAGGTGGYTYLQREAEGGLDRIAEDIGGILRGEYLLQFRSTSAVGEAGQPLTITVNVGGGASTGSNSITSEQTRPLGRPINITFPRLTTDAATGTVLVAESVTFEPLIQYPNFDLPVEIATASYEVVSGSMAGTPLTPPDTSNPNYTWDIRAVVQGDYGVVLTVTDVLGNTGTNEASPIPIRVAGPLTVEILEPIPIQTPAGTVVPLPSGGYQLPAGMTQFRARVASSFAVNEAELFINNTPVAPIVPNTTAPVFSVDLRSYTGQQQVRVVGSDVRGNTAEAQMTISVLVPQSNTLLVALIIIVITALILLVLLISLAARRQRQTVAPPVIGGGPDPFAGGLGVRGVGVATPPNFEGDDPFAVQAATPPSFADDGVTEAGELPPPPINLEVRSKNTIPEGPRIEVLQNPGDPRKALISLQGKQRVGVGRSEENELMVRGELVSRQNSEIVVQNGAYAYYDRADGKAKSLINGRQVDGYHRLRKGDKIQLGETLMQYLE